MKQKHVLWMKEIHQRKENNDSVKRHFREDPRKANKMKYFLFHCFRVQVRAGGCGEEETQVEKEEE